MSTTAQLPGGSSDGRRSAIDDAARRIAFASGLSGITLRRLAATASLAPGDIALHEPSMGALIARTFEELAEIELQASRDDIAGIESPLEALRVLVATLLEETHGSFNSVWADAWALGRHNAPLASATRQNMTDWNTFVQSVIRRGMDGGVFAGSDADLVAMQFLALIDSTTAYSLVGYRTAQDRAHLTRCTLEMTLGLPEGSL